MHHWLAPGEPIPRGDDFERVSRMMPASGTDVKAAKARKKEQQRKAGQQSYNLLFEDVAISSAQATYAKDAEAEAWPRCVVRETGEFKEKWDLLVMSLILYSGVMVPFRIAFQSEAEGGMWVFEASLSLVFLVDLCVANSRPLETSALLARDPSRPLRLPPRCGCSVLAGRMAGPPLTRTPTDRDSRLRSGLNFNTAFIRKGEWVSSRRAIAANYLSSWFWIDAPASCPVELLELALVAYRTDMSALSFLRMLRVLRLVRLLRLLKLGHYLTRIEERFEVHT
jgi:hypothetical protein